MQHPANTESHGVGGVGSTDAKKRFDPVRNEWV